MIGSPTKQHHRIKRLAVFALTLALFFLGLFLVKGGWGLKASSVKASYSLIEVWESAGGKELQSPWGIAVDPRNGNVLVTDAKNNRLVVFDESGRLIREFGNEGTGPGQFELPVGVAVDNSGFIYVSDYYQDRIQKFTEAGEFLMEWGSHGEGPGQLNSPIGLTVDSKSRVYVTDFFNRRIQVFDDQGKYLRSIGSPGQWQMGDLDYPSDIAVKEDGAVLVADTYNYRVQLFDEQGEPSAAWGWHIFWFFPRPNENQKGFTRPAGIAVDPTEKRIHVADGGNHRAVLLDSEGRFVTDWRIPDAKEGLDSPMQVAVSPDGKRLYAADIIGNKVIVLKVN